MERRIGRSVITMHIISFLVFCILVAINISRYTFSITEPICNNCSLIGPYDTTVDNYLDVSDQLVDLSNFKFLVNPKPCDRYPEGLLLMIIVSSKPSNFQNRMFIRKTWGRLVHSTELVFLLGETDNQTISQEVQKEIETYGDIVKGNFVDAYRNMTYKHVMGLKWVYQHCSQAKYVLKSDDDTVVNTRELRRFLARDLSPWGAEDLLACSTNVGSWPLRDEDSKWRVTIEEYPEDMYPTFCSGWLILYSQDVVRRLLQAAQALPYFWIDDVHVTGTCAAHAHVARTDFSRYIIHRKSELDLSADKLDYFIFGPYNLSVDEMTQIWNALTQAGKHGYSSTTSSVGTSFSYRMSS